MGNVLLGAVIQPVLLPDGRKSIVLLGKPPPSPPPPTGTPMALKFFPRQSTSLTSFMREYNLSLSYCTHPSLTRALGIFFSTPTYYVFAQQAGLYGDLYSVIVSEVSAACVWRWGEGWRVSGEEVVIRAVPSLQAVPKTAYFKWRALSEECELLGCNSTSWKIYL